jgi:hypothetical protein
MLQNRWPYAAKSMAVVLFVSMSLIPTRSVCSPVISGSVGAAKDRGQKKRQGKMLVRARKVCIATILERRNCIIKDALPTLITLP